MNENIFDKPIHYLEISVRAQKCLLKHPHGRINTIRDLVKMSDGELLIAENFGRKSLKELKDQLECYGLYLGMNTDVAPEPIVEHNSIANLIERIESLENFARRLKNLVEEYGNAA